MIAALEQTKTNFDLEYRLSVGGRALCTAAAPFRRGEMTVEFTFAGGESHTLYFNPGDRTWGGSMADRLSFKILEDGALAGRIRGASQRTGLLRAYPYYEVEYRGRRYEAYEVGLGARGLYLCLYEGERPVAMAAKALTVTDYQDRYTLYLQREELLALTAMVTVYYDLTCYGDLMELSVHSVKEYRRNTVQKELLDKYDPAFIPGVLARERQDERTD